MDNKSEVISFGNNYVQFSMILKKENIKIVCNENQINNDNNDFKYWHTFINEINSKNCKPINAKNLFEIISKWFSGDETIKKYYNISIPNKIEEDEDPYIKIIQINPFKDLQDYYIIEFKYCEYVDKKDPIICYTRILNIENIINDIKKNIIDINIKLDNNIIKINEIEQHINDKK